MKRYWDLTRKERSELTSEQIDAMVVVEMMEQGVVSPETPELLPVDDVPDPDVVLYCPKSGYSTCGFGYRSAELASKLLADAVDIDSNYIGGENVYVAGKDPVEIIEKRVYSPELFAVSRAMIEKNLAATNENKSRSAAYSKGLQKVTEATKGVWSDFYECQSEARDNKKIIDTYNEYLKHCDGDASKALFFLSKAYDACAVSDAFSWFGMEQPVAEVAI